MSRKAFTLWIVAIVIIGALALLVLYTALNQAKQAPASHRTDDPPAQGR